MKKILNTPTLLALLASAMPLASHAQTVFNDNFSSSTVNSSTPGAPTASSTAYQIMSGKSWNPTPSITAGDLQFGIGPTTGGTVEAQALFASSPVSLSGVGDFVRLTLTFTDTSGILNQNGFLGVGMYNSGGVGPFAGGLNGTAVSGQTGAATGGAQNWVGYVAQIGYSGSSSRIMNRLAQTGTGNNNQDVVTSGSSTYSYHNPGGSTIGSASTGPSVSLTAGNVYTEDLKFTLTASGLQIDNNLYNGNSASGSPISTMTATDGSPAATSFDAFGIGLYEKANTAGGPQFDLNRVLVTTVPEPSSLAMILVGGLGLVLVGRRRLLHVG